MLRSDRGWIAAMALLACACLTATQTRAADSPEAMSSGSVSSVSAVTSENLVTGRGYAPTIDVDWMLRDNRQTLPECSSLIDPALEAARPSLLSPRRTSVLPRVDPPQMLDQQTAVNDMLVPIPVLSVGWSIVLCAILFKIGARVLRVQRARG